MHAVFIRIETTLEKAKQYKASPTMRIFDHNGVHLTPNEPAPYIQRTIATEGIEIESPTVIAFTCAGVELEDVSEYFDVVSVFQDPDTGLPQLYWSLTNMPDFGYRLIYLRIQQGANTFYYTSLFCCTAQFSEYTSRLDYRDKSTDPMQSVGFQLYYKEPSDIMEQEVYDTVLNDRRVPQATKFIEFDYYQTRPVDINLFRLLKKVFTFRYKYLNYEAATLMTPFETPRRQADENFAEQELQLATDATDIYDPFYVPYVPPPPPPPERSIILNQVLNGYDGTVSYVFEYVNFSPPYASVEYSVDGVTWIPNTGSPNSPRNVQVPNAGTSNYYYSVYYAPEDIRSNILQLTDNAITITAVSQIGTSDKFSISYTIQGFIQQQSVLAEVSLDGVTWQNATQSDTIQNPKPILRPTSFPPYTKFRLRYSPLGLFSNIFEI